MSEPLILTPDSATFSSGEDGPLVLHMEGEEDRIVGIRRMFPASYPKKLLSVHDEEDEIGTIADLGEFSHEQQRLVEEEIKHQYFVPCITEIKEIKDELGYFIWNVVTDHGPRKFFVKGRTDSIHSHRRSRSGGAFANMQAHGKYRMFISDIEDCKYEIEDFRKLSKNSRLQLEKVM
ncbi:DUF1854 domain-containing protein [Verrucomicrobiota bacterium]